MNQTYWVIDAKATGDKYPPFVICPLSEDGDIILGLTLMTDKPPNDGKITGIFHDDGEQAAIDYFNEHERSIREHLGDVVEFYEI